MQKQLEIESVALNEVQKKALSKTGKPVKEEKVSVTCKVIYVAANNLTSCFCCVSCVQHACD